MRAQSVSFSSSLPIFNFTFISHFTYIEYSHGALYKVLGELEAKEGRFARARELFALGLSKDPHCAAVYHAAALLEAKLGNLEVIRSNDICVYFICLPPT